MNFNIIKEDLNIMKINLLTPNLEDCKLILSSPFRVGVITENQFVNNHIENLINI